MYKILTIIFCLNYVSSFGQVNTEHYRFSRDILDQIDRDTTIFKYQMGATELSFSGYYEKVLKAWDRMGIRDFKTTKDDSTYFVSSKKINAKDYIIEQSEKTQIIIINEAHHISKHRTFTKSLLNDLYNNGYRYIGLEALFDTVINVRKFPVIESGYYIKEPEFGNLLSEALKIGYTIFGYEASMDKRGKDREIEQAANIQKFIDNNPEAKVIIHCGYDHVYENDYPAWGKAMAGRLKDITKIDPLTIDQKMFIESSDDKNNHLFIKMNDSKEPIVLLDNNELVFNGFGNVRQTDIVVLHPPTKYINNRPDWLLSGKEIYRIPSHVIKNGMSVLVLAYRENEFEQNGVPADIIEITDNNSVNELYLEKGVYTIVIKDKDYNIIEKYNHEIN